MNKKLTEGDSAGCGKGMIINMKKNVVYGIIAAYLCLGVIIGSVYNHSRKMPWYEKHPVICHALGSTEEGDTLTNSKEAFLYNYERGQRVFEADIQITSDGVMILRHDWGSDLGQAEAFGWTEEESWPVTKQEFLSAPIYGKYTPLTLEDWFAIMEKYPNIYMVTDTKYSSEVEEQFQLLVDTAIENGYENVLSRVIVQIYYKEMYDEVMAIYPFRNLIWTLYYIGYSDKREILDFMEQKDIPVLVMPSGWWDDRKKEDLVDSNIKVYVHTVNDKEEGNKKIKQGVYGLYSDDILPIEVSQWKNLLPE